jgi:hypothetical protein
MRMVGRGFFALRLGILMFSMFCVACFKSCEEIQYRVKGKETSTTIKSIDDAYHGRGGHDGYTVRYLFHNENTGRTVKGYTDIGPGERDRYEVGQQIEIEYIGGDVHTSRIRGTSNMVWIVLLGASLMAAMLAFGVAAVRLNRMAEGARRR